MQLMNHSNLITLAMILGSVITSPTIADDYGYADSSSDMIERLQGGEVKKPKTRTFNLGDELSGKNKSFTYQVKRIRNGKIVEGTQTRGFSVVGNASATSGPNDCAVNLKIEFDFNSFDIRQNSHAILSKLGRALASDKLRGSSFLINGHTDSDGSDAYNLDLSLNRALSVKKHLVKNYAVDAGRLEVVGYGENMPLVPNTSPVNKQLNRRVEVQAARCGI